MPATGVAIADIVKDVSGRVDQGRSLLIDYREMNDEQPWKITAIEENIMAELKLRSKESLDSKFDNIP